MRAKHVGDLIRRHAPPHVYALLVTLFWLLHPRRPVRIVWPAPSGWYVWYVAERMKVLTPGPWHLTRGTSSAQLRKAQRYSCSEFVEVDRDDIVVDVGAFIGEFSLGVATRASRVIAIEGSEKNWSCLLHNTSQSPRVEPHFELVWKDDAHVTFHLSYDPTDNSIIGLEEASGGTIVRRPARRLDSFLSELGIEEVDFLKIDAEGAEPEVLMGAAGIRIRKLAIDCSPERLGESTADAVSNLLQERGYEVRFGDGPNQDVVFARWLAQA